MDQLLNKQIKVIFDDGEHVTFKIGILTKIDSSFIFLNSNSDAIALSRIIRCEVLNE